MKLRSLALVCAFASCWASAEVLYRVTPSVEQKAFLVSISFTPKGSESSVQMPTWGPGSYVESDFWRNVKDFAAHDEKGKELTFTHPNNDTWQVATAGVKRVTVTYSISAVGGRFGGAASEAKIFHYGGPGTYMYVVDRKLEPCHLEIVTPASWKVATGLTPSKTTTAKLRTFDAKNYDLLADNPVTVGDFIDLKYKLNGREEEIALRGDNAADVDPEKIIKATRFVSHMEEDFFGETPYKKYVWHFSTFDRPDGAGGLEHLNSTQITLAPSVGPRVVGVLAHEKFHLWNVKRIRSRVLGPFDYRKLPETGALWWLEGVTDYYAYTLLHRYGWSTDKKYYGDIVRNVDTIRRNQNRLKISPYDSSFRVKEANNGRGNSDGLMVSYYPTGWVLGMMLDIELRDRTKGKYSLDDVERALWNECKNDQPGFREDEIRRQLVHFGGSAMGACYDDWVMKPGDLPVEAELAKVGLNMQEKQVPTPDIGFRWTASRSQGGVLVASVVAKDAEIKANDVITEANGVKLGGLSVGAVDKAFRDLVATLKAGDTLSVKGKRGDTAFEATAPVTSEMRRVHSITESSEATSMMRKLREGWFFAGKGRPKVIQDTVTE